VTAHAVRRFPRTTLAPRWRFDWRTRWEDVWAPDFRRAWDELLAETPGATVYHHPDLVRAWAETHGRAIGAEPFVTIARSADGARVLCAFVVLPERGRYATRRLLAPAGMGFFGYHDPLVAGRGGPSAVDWGAFWEAVRRSVGNHCDQARIPSLHEACAAGPLAHADSDPSPVLSLQGLASLADALSRCSANHRGDIGRRIRRLREKGELSFEVAGVRSAGAALADFHARFVPAYAASWRARPEGCMLDRPGVGEFVGRVVADGVAAGWARYDALSLDGQPIAWHIGLAFRQRLYWWIPAHDRTWERYSPGKVLLALLIERAIGDGARDLHLLAGAQRYKLEWKADVVALSTIRWHAPTAKGTALAWYDASRRMTRSR
jgi:CelD/BcsL family acetyltransferase involved in cellulose biosynthesis